MEDEDFVADSDEDEQEMLEALALAEERLARQRLEETNCQPVLLPEQEQEQPPTVKEQDAIQKDAPVDQYEAQDEAVGDHDEDQVETVKEHAEAQDEILEEVEDLNVEEVDEQAEAPEEVIEEKEEAEDGETDEERHEADQEEHEIDGVMEVGTLVEVDSRTWPGINKQGGAGRIVRVHRERAENGELEEIFYDVRYTVEGGVEKHIEREYVHSSALLSKHSNRKRVDREYYHDGFINEPHQRKMREAEEKRERIMAHPEQAEPHSRKQKRPRRSARAEQVPNNPQQNPSRSESEVKKRLKMSTIDEDMFVFSERSRSSLEVSSLPTSHSEKFAGRVHSAPSPVVDQPSARQRRRHRILDSSDEESSDGGSEGGNRNNSPDQIQDLVRANRQPSESRVDRGIAQDRKGIFTDQHRTRKRKKRKTSRRRYVGGYELNGEDEFIQPEGDPAELPEDVVRETGLRLAPTRHGLMKQLQEIFTQQQKHIADFYEEQKLVAQKLKNLLEMPLNELQELHQKLFNLDKVFLTKTLVNAGEDVMDKISNELERRGKLPAAFDTLDSAISKWKDELKECTRWVNHVTRVVNDAFTRREEQIPIVHVAQAEYSSDSSYLADDNEGGDIPYEAGADPESDGIDFSFDYEPENVSNTKLQKLHFERDSKVGTHRSKAVKQAYRKKVVTSTTLDDYFSRQGLSNGFRSNLRLIGRQKTILPSDPRFNWAKIARRKQQHVRIGVRERSSGPPSIRHSGGFEGAYKTKETSSKHVTNHDDSGSVQAKLMQFRDKRFRAQQSQHRPHKTLFARSNQQPVRSFGRAVYPADIPVDNNTSQKIQRPTRHTNPTIHSNNTTQQSINWEAVFEVVSDDPCSITDGDSTIAISRQGKEALLAFGHPICGPLVPHHLIFNDKYEFEDSDSFRDVVTRRTARLRQLVNDLRLQETSFMDSLSSGGLGAINDEGYANTPEWVLLVSLEEAYHRAIASLVTQLLEALEGVSALVLSRYIRIALEEIAGLLRQLPDYDSLFNGCKAYFFFFEVASRDASTTPLLTAISRTYWYCLSLLVALRPLCGRSVESHKREVEDAFLKTLPVNRVILAVVLFLFDLYIYLPSSHRLENKENEGSSNASLPALSLWLLIRGCCTSSNGVDQPDQESLSTKETQFWALLQTVYRQRYFDEITRCFIRGESSGGYLREFAQNATDGGNMTNSDEVFESQLLALEATWDLVAVLTRIYANYDGNEHDEAVCDAKWAVVKDLLHPGKRDFLPFNLTPTQASPLPLHYCQHANLYKQQVLKRVTMFSKLWRPCKEVIELILHQIWDDELYHSNNIVELPQLLKQFSTQCKELGNSRSRLAAFADKDDDPDLITCLCKIIWIQLLKLEKRVHRSRFRSSILNAIPRTPDSYETALSQSAPAHPTAQISGSNWNWGPKVHIPAAAQPVIQPKTTSQRSPSTCGVGKERMSTAVLLTFAVVGVCLECGEEQQFPIERPDKEIRYMEREVDFYCKEILRWTSEKPECEVLAAQALFILGALLLEKNSTEFPTIFSGFNDKLESSMRNMQTNPLGPPPKLSSNTTNNFIKTDKLEESRQRCQSAAMSSLYLMRDLIRMMFSMPFSGVRVGRAYGSAVEKSLEHVFGAGMEACLNGVIQKFATAKDLKIAMEIFQLVLPRAPDKPERCLAVTPAPSCKIDYMDDDEFFATIDQAMLSGGQSTTPIPSWTVKECRPKAIQLIISKLRVVLQQLVLNYPPSDTPAFDELYAIDLLGMILSTREVQFFWSSLTPTSAKFRNLAPRLLSAALKYNPEKEWLINSFLRENGADQELSTAWLLGTLDISALNTNRITFILEENLPFGVGKELVPEGSTDNLNYIRDSDYWTMLTDGIIYHLLRSNSVGFGTMDPHLLQLLREVASTCKFPKSVRANKDVLHDIGTLYDLHLDVFQSFCRSVSSTWRVYTAEPSSNWHGMNQFRVKMVHPHSGIFVAFLEAYKINFRRASREIDKMNHDWHLYGKLFVRQAGVNVTSARSYHEMDDSIKSFDKRLTGLTTMFRFMYQCMDAFLFYCGEMAIGETNLFFNAMELLFRQVNSAEYPQAIKRLEDQRRLAQQGGVRNVNDELRKDFCLPATRFVDSVQLFFARQKYPTLLYWFAQTSEIYQTFKKGWRLSPLRTLLVNMLDPDGPLGIYSYYPDDDVSSGLDVDIKTVRREAFYLSCGFFNCRCTRSFEHSRAQISLTSCGRLKQLRDFVLDDFMRETFVFLQHENVMSLLETMVPLNQFVRAVLNHANLNVNNPPIQGDEQGGGSNSDSLAHYGFQLNELHPYLEWIVECLIKLVPGTEVINSTLCCVLLTELCGIVCEAISFNEHHPMLELIDWVELVLSYLQTIYVALSKQTTAMIDPLFAAGIDIPPLEKLSTYQFTRSAFRDIVVEERFSLVSVRQMDSYGISLARATTDLFAAIVRVARQCKTSSDVQLQGFSTVSV